MKEDAFSTINVTPEDIQKITYIEGTGTIGGWEKSKLRTYLNTQVWSLIPTNIQNQIVTVKDTVSLFDEKGIYIDNQITTDKLWVITSIKKISKNYKLLYGLADNRIKTNNGTPQVPQDWWTKRVSDDSERNKTWYIGIGGYENYNTAYYKKYIALGFCF